MQALDHLAPARSSQPPAPRVLVVEDNSLAAETLCELVRDHGFEVAALVGTIDKALAAARSESIDGAVLDVNLHGEQSFPVCAILQDRGIPFVFVTGYPDTVLPPRLRNSSLLAKPVQRMAFQSALDGMVTGRAAMPSGNALLDALGQADRAGLSTLLKPVTLKPGQLLHAQGQPVDSVVFPIGALVSLTGRTQGRLIEVGMIASEGAIGLASCFDRTPLFDARVEVAGRGLCIDSGDLERRLSASESLGRHLLGFYHALVGQIGEAVVAHGRGSINQRLARRLLMTQDRLCAPSLEVTHETLSSALGVRRASVTVALQVLEGEGLIRASRKSIRILDRHRLMQLVEGMYTPLVRNVSGAARQAMN